jgi:dethiobiotin synthetase
MKGVFLTGTDTDSGKTRVAVALIRRLRENGLRVAPFKPVAAGAEETPDGLCNQDALRLIAAAGGEWPYERVNPYCFAPPISPHLAAEEAGVIIESTKLRDACGSLAAMADLVVVEGAGGWLAPLGDDWGIEALAIELGLPVVLVVGLRLGCLNHALLSAARIQASGLPLLGWVGSVLDPQMSRLERNIQALERSLGCPSLGVLPHLGAGESGASYLGPLSAAVISK